MEKEFIPYEEALALKELGFDVKCFAAFDKKKKLQISTSDYWDNQSLFSLNGYFGKNTYRCLAPLYQQAFKWFREKHDLLNHITTHLNPYGEDGALEESYGYRIMINRDGWKCGVWEEKSQFDTFEEAELSCLHKLIEIVKQK
jgi:hypothetical protein